jgi:hypothetical protein
MLGQLMPVEEDDLLSEAPNNARPIYCVAVSELSVSEGPFYTRACSPSNYLDDAPYPPP